MPAPMQGEHGGGPPARSAGARSTRGRSITLNLLNHNHSPRPQTIIRVPLHPRKDQNVPVIADHARPIRATDLKDISNGAHVLLAIPRPRPRPLRRRLEIELARHGVRSGKLIAVVLLKDLLTGLFHPRPDVLVCLTAKRPAVRVPLNARALRNRLAGNNVLLAATQQLIVPNPAIATNRVVALNCGR